MNKTIIFGAVIGATIIGGVTRIVIRSYKRLNRAMEILHEAKDIADASIYLLDSRSFKVRYRLSVNSTWNMSRFCKNS